MEGLQINLARIQKVFYVPGSILWVSTILNSGNISITREKIPTDIDIKFY